MDYHMHIVPIDPHKTQVLTRERLCGASRPLIDANTDVRKNPSLKSFISRDTSLISWPHSVASRSLTSASSSYRLQIRCLGSLPRHQDRLFTALQSPVYFSILSLALVTLRSCKKTFFLQSVDLGFKAC